MIAELGSIFQERGSDLLAASWEHLSLSLTALLIALIIGIPLAIGLRSQPRIAEGALQVTSVLQTIPSLALLGLLIPLVGIGTVPALIALVVYALLPIFQNTYVGLTVIDASIEEAAVAFGMSPLRRLLKVEIPIALPVIVSGIRQALVLIIGTATLAALIGGGGLGTFILLGIDRNQPLLTLVGAIASALLALTFSALIKFLQNKSPLVVVTSLLGLFLVIGGVNLYQNVQSPDQKVVIAGKLGSEPDILINMYQELIQAEDDQFQVELKPNFGKTSFLFEALDHQEVDVYPEFSGTILGSLLENPPANHSGQLSKEETYDLAKQGLEEEYQLTLLEPMAYENTYAILMRRDQAQAMGIKKISDLKPYADKLRAGFTLEFIDREDGYQGIQALYQLHFGQVSSMEPALRYQAIAQGEVDLVDGYSTDSEIKAYDLVALEDDLGLFPHYQGAPMLRVDYAKDHPQVVAALNRLAGIITEEEMIQMNYQVSQEGQSAQEVAHQFLLDEGLIGGGK
ncbi:ABC transporter permease/substrate-binding protein [Aerococcus urinae]|uniref:ABC transporter permease/substrate-binding protein n=1 Tax=Aerococcus urinae TaxID=1376 RepID=UPI00254EB38A|nr:ABC transporter permease/substrate-binding protein [Aerococcus urinae]MDK7191574.1 ABC transporter permease/substrate-binding protein [Aerococcus urinae]MDK8391188.1 ABC transporter permease/substrate-binding protein [Aerococcus urinae]